jgi:hypothetical protein
MSRINITDWDKWGKLVKGWVTGTDCINDGNPYPKPKTLEELKAQLSTSRAGSVPDGYSDLAFYEYGPPTLVIALPSKDMFDEGERTVMTSGTTRLPAFYKVALDCKDRADHPSSCALKLPDEQAALDFYANRIGEYTINNCA